MKIGRYYVLSFRPVGGMLYVADLRHGDADISHLFGNGYRIQVPFVVAVPNHDGRVLPYFHTAFDVPILSAELGAAVKDLAGDDVELVPVRGIGRERCSLNVPRVVDCVDEHRSQFVRVGADVRPDRADWYKYFDHMCIAASRLSDEVKVFMPARWSGIIVCAAVRERMLTVGCEGAVFTRVEVV